MLLPNRLAWEPLDTEATIIGNGPSLKLLLEDPSLTRGPIFLAHTAGLSWPYPAYLWCSLHSEMLLDKYDQRKAKGWPLVTLVGNKVMEPEGYPYFCYKGRWWPGGTSGLFAVEIAASIGYKKLHVFGIDLVGIHYEGHRPHWDVVHGVELIGYGGSLKFMEGIRHDG